MRAFVALACALSGCSQAPLTEVLLVADTDLAVPSELTGVRFEVEGPRGDLQTASVDFADGDARPAVLALVHRGGPLGPLRIEVIGQRGAEEVLRRTARVEFVAGRVLALHVVLRERCVEVSCGAGATCGDDGCRSIDVQPGELEPWNGGPGADAGVDAPACACDDGIACTVDACRDEGCAHEPDPSACEDDGVACTRAVCDAEGGCAQEPDDGACDDGIACTADRCDPSGGCVHEPDDGACDDGIACTVDRCDPSGGCERAVAHAGCAPGEVCDDEDGCERGPSFTEVYAFLEDRCVSCHDAIDPAGGLDLSTQAQAWTNLVGVASSCDASVHVVPRDARASLLWRKVARVDLCGERMPPSGPPASSWDAARIERWIQAGALND